MKVNVFTGPNCSLCEQAITLVNQLQETDAQFNKIEIVKINIRNSTEHYHLYATRIPVLQIQGTSTDLGWPFTIDELRAFLQ